MLEDIIERFALLIENGVERLRVMDDDASEQRPRPEGWSAKETLGHLVDAASNCHQCLARGQLDEILAFPDYDHRAWIRIQRYQDEPWEELIELWKSYNWHLIHVITCMSEQRLKTTCLVGRNKPIPLSKLVVDYVEHVDYFLKKI